MSRASSSGGGVTKRSPLELASEGEKAKKIGRKSNDNLTPEQQAVQAVWDSFRGCQNEDLHSKKIDGATVYDHVLAGKKNDEQKNSLKMGRKYYNDLRSKCNNEKDALAVLECDKSLDVKPRLFKAMCAAMKSAPNRSALLELLEVEEAPNHKDNVKESLGILKWRVQQPHKYQQSSREQA